MTTTTRDAIAALRAAGLIEDPPTVGELLAAVRDPIGRTLALLRGMLPGMGGVPRLTLLPTAGRDRMLATAHLPLVHNYGQRADRGPLDPTAPH